MTDDTPATTIQRTISFRARGIFKSVLMARNSGQSEQNSMAVSNCGTHERPALGSSLKAAMDIRTSPPIQTGRCIFLLCRTCRDMSGTENCTEGVVRFTMALGFGLLPP